MSAKKDIAAVTVSRADFGRLIPTLKAISADPKYNLKLLVTGGHCLSVTGNSINEIKNSGFNPSAVLHPGEGSDSRKASRVLKAVGSWLGENSPDYLIVIGDRFEMLAAANAAVIEKTPVIHIGGGFKTSGSEDKIRLALSSLADQHFVASEKCQERVSSMGCDDETIHLLGAPDLEILENPEEISREEFMKTAGLDPGKEFLLVTFHPESGVNFEENGEFMKTAATFLKEVDEQIMFTPPCADPGAYYVFSLINEVKKQKQDTVFIENPGVKKYVSAMRFAKCMVGNSSSGIIESATLGLPVLNVGNRQNGKEQSGNVINSRFQLDDLLGAYNLATSDSFRDYCKQVENIYGDCSFSKRFIKVLKKICW